MTNIRFNYIISLLTCLFFLNTNFRNEAVIIDEKFPDIEKLKLLMQEYTANDSDSIGAFFSFLFTSQKFSGKMESFLTKFNLTNTQLSILLLLHSNKNSFETPSSIAKKLGLSIPTISNVLKTLHKKEYIQKQTLPENKKSSYITLDKNGIDFLKVFIPLCRKKYEDFLSNFNTKELYNLENLSLKIFSNLDFF